MTDHTEVADVLDGAADLIEKVGWAQGMWRTDKGEVCITQAIADASPFRTCSYREVVPLRDVIGLPWDMSLVRWNDAPGRTEQEVLDALRASAKAERRLADAAS
jgi:hypothetical protein